MFRHLVSAAILIFKASFTLSFSPRQTVSFDAHIKKIAKEIGFRHFETAAILTYNPI